MPLEYKRQVVVSGTITREELSSLIAKGLRADNPECGVVIATGKITTKISTGGDGAPQLDAIEISGLAFEEADQPNQPEPEQAPKA